jgi:hypothetical protein
VTKRMDAGLKPAHQQILANFDSLPDSAEVPLPVVAALKSVSQMTVLRHVKQGLLPKPVKVGPSTRWIVGQLRRKPE